MFLFAVVFPRAQATYWLGRAAVSGALQTRWRGRLEGPGMVRAQAYLDRWGPWGVPASFLTIGFQTLVQLAAGMGRMRYSVYTLAMIPGCVAWAGIYTGFGYAAFQLVLRFTWVAAIALVIASAIVTVIVVRRRRSVESVVRTPR
ncbi:MAG: hypothetical protein JW722_06075 [Demequinaceae bacterium]|nr:hypothetical protein [Demequinaceae bacterium]